jgi:hypothetical protein
MSDGWSNARLRSDEPEPISPTIPSPSAVAFPTGINPPEQPTVTIVDHFDLAMIDSPVEGAVLFIRPISRPEAMNIARESGAKIYAVNERGLNDLEQQLSLQAEVPRPRLSIGGKMLVMTRHKWNDVRWHLIEFQCDGDGVVE